MEMYNLYGKRCGWSLKRVHDMSTSMQDEVVRHWNEYLCLFMIHSDMPHYDISHLWERGGLVHIAHKTP